MTDFQVTLSIVADTPEALSNMTVQAQLNWGMKLTFFDFTQRNDNKYICWYNISHLVYAEKVLNGAKE